MKPPVPTPDLVWPFEVPAPPSPEDAREAGLRMPRTPQQRRADETTRVARELTDAEAERRHAATERLRAARLAKEVEALAAAPPPKPKAPKRVRKAKL